MGGETPRTYSGHLRIGAEVLEQAARVQGRAAAPEFPRTAPAGPPACHLPGEHLSPGK